MHGYIDLLSQLLKPSKDRKPSEYIYQENYTSQKTEQLGKAESPESKLLAGDILALPNAIHREGTGRPHSKLWYYRIPLRQSWPTVLCPNKR